MTETTNTNLFGGPPSNALNHIEHSTNDEMPEYIANSTLKDQERTVNGWRTSIYKFYFPLVAQTGETCNPYQCVKHMLAILGKQCKNQFRVLPKNEKDDKNEAIAIWTDFPTSKEAADAYLFNTRYPKQNFGARAGAVDFVTELRVSTNHSASWLKQQDGLVTEFKRHKYWLRAREDTPPVPIRPILWLGGPDPDNCSTSNLRAILQTKAPTTEFLHLEKHRITSKPDGQKKVFITHVIKVSAPTATAWSASRQLLAYLNNVSDDQKPPQLRKVKGVPISNRDISKPALAAAITEQNKYLDHSAAVQIVNVWKLDTNITITDALLEALANYNLDEMSEPHDIRPFLSCTPNGQTNIRNLLYALVEGRPDMDSNLIRDDYIRGRSWNIVCDVDVVQAVSSVAETFIGALTRALSAPTVARICGSNNPQSPDKQPRVEYVKQYKGDGTILHPTFGSNLKEFSEQYGVPLHTPQKKQTTDFSRPPRATFAQAHLQRTRVVTAERATWAAVVYEGAFNQKEPKTNPFQRRKRKSKKTSQQTQSTTTTTQQSPPTPPTQETPTPPTDTPTDAPAAEPPIAAPTQAPATSQYQLKVDAMEIAIAQMQESKESLDTTVKRLEANVEKISSSVELIAKSQTDLQQKFESFMEAQTATKEHQQDTINALIEEAMHQHVYPQLNTLLNQTTARLDRLEKDTPQNNTSQPTTTPTDNNPYRVLDEDMAEAMSTPPVSGQKHQGSPSRSSQTPHPKRTTRSPPQSPAATPGSASSTLFPATQDYSGFTKQSQLSGGTE